MNSYMVDGNNCLKKRDFEGAKEIFRNASQKFPNHGGFKERLAHIAFIEQDFTLAQELYQCLVEQHPDIPSAFMGYGNTLINLNNIDGAKEVFRNASLMFPNHSGLKERLAHVAFIEKDFVLAQELYQHLVEQYPDTPSGFMGHGNILINLNNLEGAKEIFQNASLRFPNHSGFKERLAHIAFIDKDFVLAQELYQCLVEQHPDIPSGFMGCGNTLINLNNLEGAKNVFRNASQRFPNHSGFKERLAHIALKDKDFTLALELYQSLFEQSADFNTASMDTIIERLYCQGSASDIEAFADLFDTHWRRDIVVFGCSHARATFSKPNLQHRTPLVLSHPGSTVSGFGKRKSTLGTFSKIENVIEALRSTKIIFKFGQVDVDLGLYYRLFVKGEKIGDLSHFFTTIIAGYLEAITAITNCHKYICGINMPTLINNDNAALYTSRVIFENEKDKIKQEELFCVLKKKLPPYRDRFSYSQEFNQILQKECRRRDLIYFDFTDEFCTKGCVMDEILCPNDHHYFLKEKHLMTVWGKVSQILQLEI